MKITWRILLAFILCTSAGFYFLVHWMLRDLRPRYMEAVEETLVDCSRLLASQLETDVRNRTIRTGNLKEAFSGLYQERFAAQIYDLYKNRVDMRVYVTDSKGIVLFDSQGIDVGKDYSRWNDVYQTLQGKYGARSTRADPNDPSSSVMYVAAPIQVSGKIQGVVTVAKPADAIKLFLINARLKVFSISLAVLVAILVTAMGVSLWIARPVKKLTVYAKAVGSGQRVALPELGKNEMGDLGRAFEDMRRALEGKKYVEQYVQLLTHEVKGPLSAIRGAAELLEEKMPTAERKKFLGNIQSETARLQHIVDRLLLLSSVESRQNLEKPEEVDVSRMVKKSVANFRPAASARKVSLLAKVPGGLRLKGDPFLLEQALANLIQNALEFSSAKGKVMVTAEGKGGNLEIRVEDEGTGIPPFALDRVFEKFYSLKRPDTGRKSSGLGLSLVKEVASLHGGSVRLENRPEGGTRAILTLPSNIS